jgi:hypothetical protein
MFGIYPLHVAGTPFGVADGPADDYEKIRSALADLRGARSLNSRTYLVYTRAWEAKTLAKVAEYAENGLLGDVVVGCGDWTAQTEQQIEMENWLKFISLVIRRHGAEISSVQITNEPNLSFMEGSKAYIYEALTQGVLAAKEEIVKAGFPIEVGFGSVPHSPVAVADFWERLAQAADEAFLRSVDFVGHNFYVDVFEEEPVAIGQIPAVVDSILSALRTRMSELGLPPTVPIRVTENGWPTGINPVTSRVRSAEQQSKVLETIIRAISDQRQNHNVSHYSLFGLRDADSSNDSLFHQYGILRDDYTTKPAYSSFRTLIHELGA